MVENLFNVHSVCSWNIWKDDKIFAKNLAIVETLTQKTSIPSDKVERLKDKFLKTILMVTIDLIMLNNLMKT